VLVAEVDLLAPGIRDGDAVEFFANLCKEGFAKSQMEEFYEQHQASNKHTLAAVLLTDHMLNQLRLGLKRIFPNVQIDTNALEYSLRNDVLKRELIDGDEASGAAALLKKATRAAAKRKKASKVLLIPPSPLPSPVVPLPAIPAPTAKP
jgi:hypothetical protein